MNSIKTFAPYTVKGPTVSTSDYRLPLPITNQPCNIKISNASATVAGQIQFADLWLNNTADSKYLYSGVTGTNDAGNFANPTTTPKLLKVGNFPVGTSGQPYTGTFTSLVGATLVPTTTGIGATDVVLSNALVTGSSAVNQTSNILGISAAAQAVITLTSLYWQNPFTQEMIPLTTGMVLSVQRSTSGLVAQQNSYDGLYTITSVNTGAGTVTTSRNTTGFGTYASSGSAVALVVADPMGRPVPANLSVVGLTPQGYPYNFVNFAANSPILVAMTFATPLDLSITLEYIY